MVFYHSHRETSTRPVSAQCPTRCQVLPLSDHAIEEPDPLLALQVRGYLRTGLREVGTSLDTAVGSEMTAELSLRPSAEAVRTHPQDSLQGSRKEEVGFPHHI